MKPYETIRLLRNAIKVSPNLDHSIIDLLSIVDEGNGEFHLKVGNKTFSYLTEIDRWYKVERKGPSKYILMDSPCLEAMDEICSINIRLLKEKIKKTMHIS